VNKYTILSTRDCAYCYKAKQHIHATERTYQTIDVNENRWVKTLMQRAQMTTVPQIFDPFGNYVGGYEALLKDGHQKKSEEY
jgi:glutaredoxin